MSGLPCQRGNLQSEEPCSNLHPRFELCSRGVVALRLRYLRHHISPGLIGHADRRNEAAVIDAKRIGDTVQICLAVAQEVVPVRSEEHTSELQSLMRISYAVFSLKKKNNKQIQPY